MIDEDQRRLKTENSHPVDWSKVERILVIRLRSIGDTVLATPSLIALRRFLPEPQIDILLEDWVAPLLEGSGDVDNVVAVGKGSLERLKTAMRIRRARYDVVFNLHGGTTSTFFARASGARHRVGYQHYQYSFLYNHLLRSSSDFWHKEQTHSAEQQLALLGFTGVPVNDRPKTRLNVIDSAVESLDAKFTAETQRRRENVGDQVSTARVSRWRDVGDYALLHPAAAFATKQWAAENFAHVAEYLAERGIKRVAVATKNERPVLDRLADASRVRITRFDDLSLPEITALASRAKLFVGNDSGIAHIAAAVNTPSVVIFGSSNRNHWYPWTDAPAEMVFEKFPCQPCPGYECREFGKPRCILSVPPESVIAAIDRVLGVKKVETDWISIMLKSMLTQYIQAAMRKAKYEILEGDEGFYGEIPGFQGVWANATSLEDCRDQLAEVLEEWILFHLADKTQLPKISGIDLRFKKTRQPVLV